MVICSTRPVPRRRRREPEFQQQSALIKWSIYTGRVQYPELQLLFAVPSGRKRSKIDAGKLKAEGVKAGVPDLCLPVARCGFHGAWIEMKSKDGRVSLDQNWWHQKLRDQGYYVVVCWDWSNARTALSNYLDGRVTVPQEDV